MFSSRNFMRWPTMARGIWRLDKSELNFSARAEIQRICNRRRVESQIQQGNIPLHDESGRAVCHIQHEKIAIQFIQAFEMRHAHLIRPQGKTGLIGKGNADAAGPATSGRAS